MIPYQDTKRHHQFLNNYIKLNGGKHMSRKEALQIGKTIADRWLHHNESTILAKQNIERRNAWEQKKLTTPASN